MSAGDPMSHDDCIKIQLADGSWSRRAYNAHERQLIRDKKPEEARINWEKRNRYGAYR